MAAPYELVSPRKGKDGRTHWIKVGVAFPSSTGKDSFSLTFEALPLPNEEGQVRVLMKPPMERDGQRVAPRPAFQDDEGAPF